VDRISQRLAAEPDAERAAHHAICTVASYEVLGLDVLPLAALEVDDFYADAVLRRQALPRSAIAGLVRSLRP
jgi:hypothetical protein